MAPGQVPDGRQLLRGVQLAGGRVLGVPVSEASAKER
ncbi:hypothetical protein P3T39_001478 [Kitasatospora sp. GP82]|nr:hypothetical protein [Kitasatospora sp. GP82]